MIPIGVLEKVFRSVIDDSACIFRSRIVSKRFHAAARSICSEDRVRQELEADAWGWRDVTSCCRPLPGEYLGHVDCRHAGVTRSAVFLEGFTDGCKHALVVWSLVTCSVTHTLRGHTNVIMDCDWHGNLLATGSRDRTARVWDLEAPGHDFVLKGHQHWIRTVAFSETGRRLCTGSEDKTARIWDTSSGALISVLKDHQSFVFCAAFCGGMDSLLTTACQDGYLRLWTADGNMLCKEEGYCKDMSPRVHYVAAAIHKSKLLRVLEPRERSFHEVCRLNPEVTVMQARIQAAKLAVGGSATTGLGQDFEYRVLVYAVPSGSLLCRIPHPGSIMSLNWSPGADLLITGSDEGCACLWTASGALRCTLAEPVAKSAWGVPLTRRALVHAGFLLDGGLVVTCANTSPDTKLWGCSLFAPH